ncbi:GNAT family N-acetyltransferase [Brachybacterium halotolerans subsp. kimchii]|uniref:GNAT family N-acetyltransferase n=1 Tax=Brachybacterium halotolerans TaxID=2795215 RepID=UPI001E65BB3E|nr:GNAT family N-acetyltransferase [Brachybacterium halotolerans]UEJ84335.1 GNAT family N-acetyltransferase [Brachybacterium halotolerans subsp. kimchii]
MSGDVTISSAESLSDVDVERIAALLSELSTSAQFDRARLMALLGNDDVLLFVARTDEAVVGMATLATFPLVTGWRGIVEDVVVSEDARGRGVARNLLEAIIAEADSLHLRTLDLTSRPSRDSAQRLYESVGFEYRDTNVMRYVPPAPQIM